MVKKKVTTPTNNESDVKENAMVEMLASMDDLRCQNQILEDNVLHI